MTKTNYYTVGGITYEVLCTPTLVIPLGPLVWWNGNAYASDLAVDENVRSALMAASEADRAALAI